MPCACWELKYQSIAEKNAEICNKLQFANVENCTADEPWSYNAKQAEVVSEASFCWEKVVFNRKQEVEMDVLVKGSMKLEEQLYLAEINHEPLKVLNARN